MVVSCIVPVAGVTLQEADVVAHLKKLLASFKVPRKVLFFEEAELAVTGSEKVKVDGLRQLAAKRLGVAYAET